MGDRRSIPIAPPSTGELERRALRAPIPVAWEAAAQIMASLLPDRMPADDCTSVVRVIRELG